MADVTEKTGQGDTSKDASLPTPQEERAMNAAGATPAASSIPLEDESIPEPVIIEETIIKPRAATQIAPKITPPQTQKPAPQTAPKVVPTANPTPGITIAQPAPAPHAPTSTNVRPIFPPKFIPPPITRPPLDVMAAAPGPQVVPKPSALTPPPHEVHPIPPTAPHTDVPVHEAVDLDIGLPNTFVMAKSEPAHIAEPAVLKTSPASDQPHMPQDLRFVPPVIAKTPAAPPPGPVDTTPMHDVAAISASRPVTPPQAAALRPDIQTDAEIHPSGSMSNDISKILGDAKLPERRSIDSGGSKKTYEVKQFDTSLGADIRDSQKAEHAAGTATTKLAPARAEASAPSSDATAQRPDIMVPVHTLKDDLQQVVHDQKISVVRAASFEQERHARKDDAFADEPVPKRSSKRFTAILFSVAMLVILGAGALFGVYLVEHARSAPTTAPGTSSILFAENTVAFPISDQSPGALKQSLAQARTSGSATLGSITQIIPTVSVPNTTDGSVSQRPATFAEFMRAIGANPPEDLLRSVSDNFFFGIHTVDKNAPLIVVPVTSYDHAFAAMLQWEPTMNSDLAPVFTAVPSQMTSPSGLPQLRTFTDAVMRNYDVRALKDDSGVIEMYYSFPTQNILVIAESPYTFTEILSRLQALRQL
jgi:hypothetical protein